MSRTNSLCHLAALSLALAACTSSSDHAPDRAGATHAFSAANTRMEAALNKINGKARASLISGSVNVSEPCGTAGAVGLTGTFETTGTTTKLDLTAAFTGCREAEGVLDGSLRYTSTSDGAKVVGAWHGTLGFTDAQDSWQCAFDFTETLDATGAHFSGTICGYDVNRELGP